MIGWLLEVTMEGKVVGEYVNPYFGEHPRYGHVNSVFRARCYGSDHPRAWCAGQRPWR